MVENLRPVLFLDSGIGGLPYYRHFHTRNPREPVVYVADRASFPYGAKDAPTLVSLIRNLIARCIGRFNPKIVVLACNSASVAALDDLRKQFPAFPFVGTVPALKPAIVQSKSRIVGLLGTERTVATLNSSEWTKRYGPDSTVIGIAAPELVNFVENAAITSDEESCERMVAPFVEGFRRAGADSIVLGCTHFLFLSDAFVQRAAPDIHIYDSISGISGRVESLLESMGRNPGTPGEPILVVTGTDPIESRWKHYAEIFGFPGESLYTMPLKIE
ncbi:glutamate racemase [Spirochaetia bacterium]|nr:glutamate racemase [Spirochaetia bacterium]